MVKQKYNGWTNYPTWDMALWMDNEYNEYIFWKDMAKRCKKPAKLANIMKEHYESSFTIRKASAVSDITRWAFEQINWNEIAEHFLED